MSFFTKLVYFILFVLLIIHPHFITGHVLYLPQAYAQSLASLLILLIAFIVYKLHQSDLHKVKTEKRRLERQLHLSTDRLLSAYQYIGLVNRRLPLLNQVTTKLLNRSYATKKSKKVIMTELLATAVVSLARSSWGAFRFIEVRSNKVISEFIFSKNSKKREVKLNLSNSDLLLSTKKNNFVSWAKEQILRTSDRSSAIQCFLILPQEEELKQNDISILQSLVDQAQILYQYLFFHKPATV